MKTVIICATALLSAGAARAAAPSQSYATVGHWEITAEGNQRCGMTQLFESKVAEEIEVLSVLYDAQKGVVLSLATNKTKYLLASGTVFLDLGFMRGSLMDKSWGSQKFDYKKDGKTYLLHHVFTRRADVDRVLRDLSSNEAVSLFLGPTLVMGLPLNAAGAVEKLRECTLKGAAPS